MRAVVEHHSYLEERGGHSIVKLAICTLQKYGLAESDLVKSIEEGRGLPQPKEVVDKLKAAQAVDMVDRLCAKAIHGVYYQTCMAPGNDQDGCHAWLTDGRVRAETEALVIAVQDGVLWTNTYQAEVVKNGTEPSRRVCHKGEETTGHILTSSEANTWSLIKERHDRVVYQLVLALAKNQSLKVPDSWRWRAQGWQGVRVLDRDKMKLWLTSVYQLIEISPQGNQTS